MSKKVDQIKNLMKKLDNTVEVSNKEITPAMDLSILENFLNIDDMKKLSEDKKIVDLLIKSSAEIFSVQVKSALMLGKVFQNVFNEIGNQNTGVYEKWLKLNGFNKYTALRYRKRYDIYESVGNSNKDIVASLPQKYIELIFQEENKKYYLDLLEKGITSKELVNILNNKTILEIEEPINNDNKDTLNFSNYEFLLKSNLIFDTISSLNEKEKIKLQGHLDSINKILKKNS